MKSGSTDGQYSSVIRVLAVVAIAFMAVSAFASIPAEQTDADGKTVTVNSWDEFKDAVDAAGNGDTIVLGSDIKADDHDDVVIEDVSDLTIDLVGHVLDKGPGGRGYEETGQLKVCGGAVVTFKNGTLRGGGVDNGGGIYIKEGSNVTLIDVNIDDPYASDEGGGIFIKDSILTMKGGEVTSCDSENDGSFLRATDSSTVTLDGVKITPWENTALAAKMVAESGRTDAAAIASHSTVGLYGLDCLAADIQDRGNNYTRFICISKDLEIYPGADKTSLMLVAPHRPGSLYQILARFNTYGL
ncbi:MAG: hypothetical protein IJ904_03605, partial [Candidatus Methanomethylophilaceae archaeon]|nr:hypothetical protein [Candidatus Methanomethylophilaceae archaeon]